MGVTTGGSASTPPVDRKAAPQPRAGVDVFQDAFANLGAAVVLGIEAVRAMLTRRPVWLRGAAVPAVVILRAGMRPVLAGEAVFPPGILGVPPGVPPGPPGRRRPQP